MKLQLVSLIYTVSLSLSNLCHLHTFYDVILITSKTISTSPMLPTLYYIQKTRQSVTGSPRPSKKVCIHKANMSLIYGCSSLYYPLLGSAGSSFRHYLRAIPRALSIAPKALAGVLILFQTYRYQQQHAFKLHMSSEIGLTG